MAKRRTFTPEFKFEAVLDMLRGEKGRSIVGARYHRIVAVQWRDAFFERAPALC